MAKTYAKIYYEDGKPYPETLKQHTENLLKQIEILTDLYKEELNSIGLEEEFFNHLKIACLFHDTGKISSHFQKKLKKILGETVKLPEGLNKEIPHNFLSGIFLLEKDLKEQIKKEYFLPVFYCVVFHHSRNIDFSPEYLQLVIEKDIKQNVSTLSWLLDYGFKSINVSPERAKILYKRIEEYLFNQGRTPQIKKDKKFIFLKGFLHRADHSASAQVSIEEKRINNPEKKLLNYLKTVKNSSGLKPFQQEASKYRNENILLTASTGMGKTEFAVNWIGKDKAFYTLPVRVSVNAMYERFSNIFGKENIGLLHSDAVFYGFDKPETFEDLLSIEEHIARTQSTRQLSMPITITTADQLFTATFKYSGYEKIYSTLAYSKIILDEPQSYSPDTLAVIIKGLQEISQLGGRFCFMSATIHPFVVKYLKDYCKILPPQFHKEKKHRINLTGEPIENLKNYMIKEYKNGKKVLVILNTVKKAQEVYKLLREEDLNVNLLHSLFIQRDRKQKEQKIQNPEEPVIWITTQLVEASLDIDYDVLFTEIASLDSLVQRMGRVYRKSGRNITESSNPNIIISTAQPSDKGKIYDKDIVNLTKEALKEFDEKILLEEDKQNLMNKVFSEEKIKNTNFFKKFIKNMELLELGFQAESKREAQQLFREIYNIQVIPENVYNENLEKIENLIESILDKSKPYPERLKSMYDLNNYTVNIPYFRIKETLPTAVTPQKIKTQIFTVSLRYDKGLGLVLEEEELGKIL
ncbi:CRISPR-associated helicase Cas3' [Persephonella atlantica]|uniref:CRISPR-associated helicase Cas3 n=1 Tax=Persephonella atlantica TaxID=2699429 RepID=A0ABS1GJT7_9AQUI|nr:CRISPR-associated helicase Cas3' [Persephonella atlantica]MBK3333105.1 CRISPR-associated helicase Cas3' [Persephonella atlantica]